MAELLLSNQDKSKEGQTQACIGYPLQIYATLRFRFYPMPFQGEVGKRAFKNTGLSDGCDHTNPLVRSTIFLRLFLKLSGQRMGF